MPKQCKLCGGIAKFVGKNVIGEDVYECTICKEPGHHSRFDDVTLFTEITKSPEALAEKLVYAVSYHWEMEFRYTSNLISGRKRFDTKEEAIAATLAKLNEKIDYE